jgi:hypothetical protein
MTKNSYHLINNSNVKDTKLYNANCNSKKRKLKHENTATSNGNNVYGVQGVKSKKKGKCKKKKGKWSGNSLKTKYKRVYKIKNSENFQSVFKHKKKQFYVGVYETALQAAVAVDFKAVEVGLPAEKLNFPENYNKYVIGLRSSGIKIDGEDLTSKYTSTKNSNSSDHFIDDTSNNIKGGEFLDSSSSPEESDTTAFFTLFNDMEYEENNELLSTTQIEIDDNLNVVDQVSLLRPPTKILSGKPRKVQNNTGFKGVFPVKTRRSKEILHYYVQLTMKGKTISIKGRYKTPKEAAKVFDLHCCAMGRGPEYCNFPSQYHQMQAENHELIRRLSEQLLTIRNKITGGKSHRNGSNGVISNSNSSSGASDTNSSATSSNTNSEDDDIDELNIDKNRSTQHNPKIGLTDGCGDDIANVLIDMERRGRRVALNNNIPDDVIFNFADNDDIDINIMNCISMTEDGDESNSDDDNINNNDGSRSKSQHFDLLDIVMPSKRINVNETKYKNVNKISYV